MAELPPIPYPIRQTFDGVSVDWLERVRRALGDTSIVFLDQANNLSDILDLPLARANLGLEIGADVQAWSAVLDGTTASFTIAEETKLAGIEALADVTDTANVTAAGALMDSELADIAAVKALDQGVTTTDTPSFVAVEVAGTQVLSGQGAAVADASGGSTVDTEARAAINALLARLRAHGVIAT